MRGLPILGRKTIDAIADWIDDTIKAVDANNTEISNKQARNQVYRPAVYTVTTLPAATANLGGVVCVSNEAGGFTMAFSDGTNWRRVQDRAIVS